ncbi:MAG: glycosyltransferase, partial [Nitrospirota bacterium]|nr:glycosyltransferase [Nitrospirota bacterium]
GIDTEFFKPSKSPGKSSKLVVGCSGNLKRDWKEGITEFIEPLAELDFIDLRIAAFGDDRYVPYEKMPDFLNSIDVYVLASASEGFPLKALEASACGRPVITTRVGGCEDLIIDGENGFFVERNSTAFAEKLRFLHENRDILVKMGERSREIIEEKWSWKIRARDWLDFIMNNI